MVFTKRKIGYSVLMDEVHGLLLLFSALNEVELIGDHLYHNEL